MNARAMICCKHCNPFKVAWIPFDLAVGSASGSEDSVKESLTRGATVLWYKRNK